MLADGHKTRLHKSIQHKEANHSAFPAHLHQVHFALVLKGAPQLHDVGVRQAPVETDLAVYVVPAPGNIMRASIHE